MEGTGEVHPAAGVRPQSAGSGAAAFGDLWPALDPFPGVHIVGLIHDEILLEVPRDLVDQVREIALACMTSHRLQKQYLGDIPLEADCNCLLYTSDAADEV